jgi:hypothetical protein
MRASRHHPRVPQPQMIDKVHLQLALGILTSLFAGIGYASSGGAKKVTGSTPPINASSKDEADFIQYVASFVSLCLSERAREIKQSAHEISGQMHIYNSPDHTLTSPFLKQAVPQGEREEGSQALDSGRQETYLFESQTEKLWELRVKAISCVYILYADVPLHERDKLAQDMPFELMNPIQNYLSAHLDHITRVPS